MTTVPDEYMICKVCDAIDGCTEDCQCEDCLHNHDNDCRCEGCSDKRADAADSMRDAELER